MNTSPLILASLASVALLSSRMPAKKEAVSSSAQPEEQALLAQIRQLVTLETRALEKLVDDSDGERPPGLERKTPAPVPRGGRTGHRPRELGLHTNTFDLADGLSCSARGLTPQGEWQHMFPRYTRNVAAEQ